MKNKKIIFIIVLAIIIILFFLIFFTDLFKKSESNELLEYTPQEEISDDEIRKTIICLYFKNIETNTLIAEAKCVDVKDLYENPYASLINMLISGPESEKLKSPIPEGTKVNSCTLKGNTVYVDLSNEFIDNAPSGVDDESISIYSIVNTLTELNEVTGVKFLINGKENQEFKDGIISFDTIFTRND